MKFLPVPSCVNASVPNSADTKSILQDFYFMNYAAQFTLCNFLWYL